tara:strand:- start:7 stop:201 length:195 start_codon:yes stop_codon:yes gene_type:complete
MELVVVAVLSAQDHQVHLQLVELVEQVQDYLMLLELRDKIVEQIIIFLVVVEVQVKVQLKQLEV